MLGLPYRRPKGEKDQIWRITTDYADITVQSGTIKHDNGRDRILRRPIRLLCSDGSHRAAIGSS